MITKLSRSRVTKWLPCLLLVAAVSGCNSDSDRDGPTGPMRDTAQGPVRGVEEETMLAFKGIPYAAPPVGELRLAAPAAPIARSSTLDASQFGNACPQAASAFGPTEPTSEDCLYLNVYTPKGDGPYPVMVWIHGGAFIVGSGASEGYDPTRLVQEEVVVVTLNYRLGALGFLPHASLSAEAGGNSGNYGLLDQRAALQWVQENIAEFGGNPNNVTIFGESAGGHSVLSHVVSPMSAGLFHKAIAQSGSYNPDQVPLSLPAPYDVLGGENLVGAPFVANAGCAAAADVPACLRDLTIEQILTAQGDSWYLPMTGTNFLPQSINDALGEGKVNVPVLLGSNLNEGNLFVALDLATAQATGDLTKLYDNRDDYDAGVAALLATDPRGLDAKAIADRYLAAQDPDDPDDPNRFRKAFGAIQTDWRFNCSNLNQWKQLSAATPTYAYWFTDTNAPNEFSSPLLQMGATHTLEIQYVFGQAGARGGVEQQVALSEMMVEYWTQFAKTGVPTSEAGPHWPEFAAGEAVLELNTPAPTATDATDFGAVHSCDYWAAPPTVAPAS